MLVLVLGSSFPVMFIGWEGVGLCSYLLIGFWFSDKANADAGKKAFIVNRIGDFGFLIAMFLLWQRWARSTSPGWSSGRRLCSRPAARGHGDHAVPLSRLHRQVGPDPALHLAARRDGRPDAGLRPDPRRHHGHRGRVPGGADQRAVRLAPLSSTVVAGIGALTALFAATIGLRQYDIKKVLAYSTVSQLGYMFLGVGTGAYAAGIFHLVTHAFFKALLFLGAGSVIHAMHHAYHATHSHADAQDMRNMGGLKQYMPVTFWLMLIATLAIAGDSAVLRLLLQGRDPRRRLRPGREPADLLLFYGMGVLAALLTAFYMARLMAMTFLGENRTGEQERAHLHDAPWS